MPHKWILLEQKTRDIMDDEWRILLEGISSASTEDIDKCVYVKNEIFSTCLSYDRFNYFSNNRRERIYSDYSQGNLIKYQTNQYYYNSSGNLSSFNQNNKLETFREWDQPISLNSIRRSFPSAFKNDEQLFSNVNNKSRLFPISFINSLKNKPMFSTKIFQNESQSSPSLDSSLPLFPISEGQLHSDTNNGEHITFEIKTSTFNRKIQVKSTQEDSIYTTKKSSPTVTCSTTTESSPPSIPNSSFQKVRVSVNSSPVQKNESHLDKETLGRRPLFDLINRLNIPNLDNHKTSSPPQILPPKQISPFRPVILHQKSQRSIGRFNELDNTQQIGVTRSRAFTTPTDVDSNQISSDKTTTRQSTPELTSSNQSVRSPAEYHSPLSTSATSLTSASNANATPTSTGYIDDKNEAKRKAIAMQMYDTEKSYVEALKNLVTKYYLPMKDKDIVSNDLINDIFYKIPEIHIHHTAFLISLSQKLSQWDNKQTVGDLLLQMFTRTSVIETYTSFVNNYQTAQIAIRSCRDFSSFNKFLEQQARDHRGKLTLRDLIIQPVQRIPRYELYLKDFLKCTNINHPDYPLLLKAQSEIHSLAEQIDHVQKEVGSTEFTLTNNPLETVQDMIENLTDLVNADRFYIRHDDVTLQSPSGLKKDRCVFLFNDLILITSCKRRSGTSSKKSTNSVIVNSASGKQYFDNAKHKLIMRISLESVDLAADYLKKRRSSIATPPSIIKSPSTTSTTLDKHRHLEEDILILGQMTDLAKTITVPHQQLDDSIKETINTANKHLLDETTSIRKTSPEPNTISDSIQQKANNIRLIINTTERTETIDVLFPLAEQKITWEKNFLEAKKILFEIAAGRRNITFQDVLTLPHNRPGSQFSCGTARPCSNDLCVCNTEGEICLIDIESDVTLQSCNPITSSQINCVAYIPSSKSRRTGSTIKHRHHPHKRGSISKQQLSSSPRATTTIDSLLDIDSSDEDEINNEDNLSLIDSSINSLESHLNNEPQNTREATMWLGTENEGLIVYECSQTMKTVGRKNRIVKQLNSSIHSILYTDNKVFLALNHRQLCVFRRDMSGRWDFDYPVIQSIEENSSKHDSINEELDNGENADAISVIALAAGRLWCAIKDRIFVVCPNSLLVQHSFVVDDCHRHICSIATGGSSVHHVWIASQGSHEIRLYHATHYACLLETSVRAAVTQKLQVCDDIIRAHKLGCLYISALHICKETLWIGTSAGVIVNLTIPQLIDSISTNGMNKLTLNSIQLKSLPFGHVGPVRFILSTDKNIHSTVEESTIVKTFVITIGDGFEDYNNYDQTLGKDDALSHLIVWQL